MDSPLTIDEFSGETSMTFIPKIEHAILNDVLVLVLGSKNKNITFLLDN